MALKFTLGASCFVSDDVETEGVEHNIAYSGALVAVVLPTNCDQRCEPVGIIFDGVTTLLVHELRSASDDEAFRAMCKNNSIPVHNLSGGPGGTVCPPPANQAQVEEWRKNLFLKYRPRT